MLKDANIFQNRKDLYMKEKDEVEPILSTLFKDRMVENKAIFKARQIQEYNILHGTNILQEEEDGDEKDLFGSEENEGQLQKKKSKAK